MRQIIIALLVFISSGCVSMKQHYLSMEFAEIMGEYSVLNKIYSYEIEDLTKEERLSLLRGQSSTLLTRSIYLRNRLQK